MDAFYASVEQRDDPSLRGRPVAVGGRPESRGVVAAASYEARVFGVRSAIPMARAVRLCPDLVILRPDFSRYAAVSQQVFAIFRGVTPLVEPLSMDEAYLDVTENAWSEPLGVAVARRLKTQIREETLLTASAGVAPNKFLAKIASGWKKPDGLTVISPERIEGFLQGLPVDALWGVGPKTAAKLRAAGIQRLVDVRTAPEEILERAVGSWAAGLRKLSFGEDDRAVNPNQERKSVGCEETYAKDLADQAHIQSEVEVLAKRTAAYLEKKRPARAHGRPEASLRRLPDDHAQRHARPFHALTRGDRGARRLVAREDRGRPPARAPPGRVGTRVSRARGEGSRAGHRALRSARSSGQGVDPSPRRRKDFRRSSRCPSRFGHVHPGNAHSSCAMNESHRVFSAV